MADNETNKPPYFVVKNFTYDELPGLNEILLAHPEKISDNGLMFFADKVVLRMVEGFDPNNWRDSVLAAMRGSLQEYVSERMAHETNVRYFKGLQFKKNMQIKGDQPAFCAKCHDIVPPGDYFPQDIDNRVAAEMAQITMTEEKIRHTRELIGEVEAGKWDHLASVQS